METMRRVRIPPGNAAERLDRALARILAGEESRTSIARLIRAGRVRVNGRPAKPALEVLEGDSIEIDLPTPSASHLAAEDLPLSVLYEDEHLAVVDKAAGMRTHPAGGIVTGTLVNALLHRWSTLSAVAGPLRPGIVHRLDKGTSGLLIVAKDDEAHRRLAKALAAREIHRTYEAVVWGRLAGRTTIDVPIGRHPRDRKRMAVTERGKPARTHARALRATEAASHLRIELETGRTHQIRVHLAHRNHPLVGDPAYGGRRRALVHVSAEALRLAEEMACTIARPALHSTRLEFVHPFSGAPMDLSAPPPADFQALVALLSRSA